MESSNDGSLHETDNDTSYSSDISDENELEKEIFEEERATKRKTDWEDRFKRFEELDRTPGLDKAWDVLNDDQLDEFIKDVDGPAIEATANEGSKFEDEGEDENYLSYSKIENESLERPDHQNDGTSCYNAEDENSVVSDPTFNEKEELGSSIFERKELMYNDIIFRIQQIPCIKCGRMTYIELSKHPLCVPCLFKEFGHDQCGIVNCFTCLKLGEVGDRIRSIEYYQNKSLDRRKKQSQDLDMTECTDILSEHSDMIDDQTSFNGGRNILCKAEISNSSHLFPKISSEDLSFEELRYYNYIQHNEPFNIPAYSSTSYRQNIEQGYDTDSSFGQSSVSSGGGDVNYPETFISRKHNQYKFYNPRLSIGHDRSHRNRNFMCTSRSPYMFSKLHDKKHYHGRLEATNYEEEIEEASSDSNAMGQSLQNEEIGITTHLSPKRAHILEEAINHKKKDSNAIITSSIALDEKIHYLSPSRLKRKNRVVKTISGHPPEVSSNSLDSRNQESSQSPGDTSLIKRFQDHDITNMKNANTKEAYLPPTKSYFMPKKTYLSPKKLYLSPKKTFISPEKTSLFSKKTNLSKQDDKHSLHYSSLNMTSEAHMSKEEKISAFNEMHSTSIRSSLHQTPIKRFIVSPRLNSSEYFDSVGEETQSESGLENRSYCANMNINIVNTASLNLKPKKRFTLKRSKN